MASELYSVEQVAERLGLHVRTVRNYVRDGRLKAVRIGKQYRITRADLESFTGGAVPASPRESASLSRRTEVTSVVQVDAIDPDAVRRLANTLIAAVSGRRDGGPALRVETVYDEERAQLKIIILGGPATVAELLRMIDTLTGGRP